MNSNVFGFQENLDQQLAAESLAGFEYQFGLNQRAKVLALEFLADGTSSGSGISCVEIRMEIGGREFRCRTFDIKGKVYLGDRQVDERDPQYQKAYDNEMRRRTATVLHMVKAIGVPEKIIAAKLAKENPKSFTEWAKAITSLVKPELLENSVDIFLEYQSNIRDGKNQTFLQIPTNLKGGAFMAPSTEGLWNEVRDPKTGSLRYENESGEVHPFQRSAGYMKSRKANRQTRGQDTMSVVSSVFAPDAKEEKDDEWAGLL